jgi:hypothetical protein
MAMVSVSPASAAISRAGGAHSFLSGLAQQTGVGSTVPANGDVNPYGVAVVDHSQGHLVAGDDLVSNFNDKGNFQGTGKSIVEIAPDGQQTLFAQLQRGQVGGLCPGGVGLTTALGILNDGFVVVGSLPTRAGTLVPGDSGCLIFLTPNGVPSFALSGGMINGPWDLAVHHGAAQDQLFVTNVLNGTVAAGGGTVDGGTVVRLTVDLKGTIPSVINSTVIGSGFPERTDPAALVVGPTGVGLRAGTLYVANSAGNDIRAIPQALTRTTSDGTGTQLTANGDLDDPLGLAIAPNGDVLTANGDDGNIVETTPGGTQVAEKLVDTNPMPGPLPGNGALFGLAVAHSTGLYFVDDDNNNLNLLSR